MCAIILSYVMWVPVTTLWHILGMQLEEVTSRYGGVAAHMLNKQSWTSEKGCQQYLSIL